MVEPRTPWAMLVYCHCFLLIIMPHLLCEDVTIREKVTKRRMQKRYFQNFANRTLFFSIHTLQISYRLLAPCISYLEQSISHKYGFHWAIAGVRSCISVVLPEAECRKEVALWEARSSDAGCWKFSTFRVQKLTILYVCDRNLYKTGLRSSVLSCDWQGGSVHGKLWSFRRLEIKINIYSRYVENGILLKSWQ